jgi:HD-GYP domain-containing protein (c-di-GMP phosphodiesterase class II)
VKDELVIRNASIFSGYSHLGTCREFVWQPTGRRSLTRFILRGLLCEYDVESLFLQRDLVLRSETGDEFLVKEFHISDVADVDNIVGEAQTFTRLQEPFPAPKSKIHNVGPVIISKSTQISALKAVAALVNEVKSNQSVGGVEANEVVEQLVGDIVKTPEAFLNLMAAKSYDDYTFSHNINVAILSLTIGRAMRLSPDEMQSLGVGAILHDIGKLRIALEIWHKEGPLSVEEMRNVKRHPVIGYLLLSNSREVNDVSRNIVLQHHEQIFGDGYPKGIRGKQIPLLARVVAIADAFDALTTDRPYRKALNPYHAINQLLRFSGKQYDPEILQVFLRRLSLYPPGTLVQVSDGQIGLVVRGHPKDLLRPVVKIVRNAAGKVVDDGPELDLRKIDGLFVTRTLKI